jgi:2-oxoglutarate dehydrogenase E1 component
VKASGAAGSWGRSVTTEPTEATGVFDGRWPAPKADPKKPGAPAPAPAAAPAPDAAVLAEAVRTAAHDSVRALMLIRSLPHPRSPPGQSRSVGHRAGQTRITEELDPANPTALATLIFDRPIFLDGVLGLPDRHDLREVLAMLPAYLLPAPSASNSCISPSRTQKSWIQARFEGPDKFAQNQLHPRGQAARF